MFAENKNDVDDIHEYFLLKGVETVAIHGGKSKFFTKILYTLHFLTLFFLKLKKNVNMLFNLSRIIKKMYW